MLTKHSVIVAVKYNVSRNEDKLTNKRFVDDKLNTFFIFVSRIFLFYYIRLRNLYRSKR